MQPTLAQYERDFGAELRCPGCGGNCLHHESIEVFDRSEDEPTGLHVMVSGSGVAVNTDLTGNPSLRRHGLKIRFSCETCQAQPILSVAQHKGQTYLDIVPGT